MFKIGDKVKVIKKSTSWVRCVSPEMDVCIGEYGVVIDVSIDEDNIAYAVRMNNETVAVFFGTLIKNH